MAKALGQVLLLCCIAIINGQEPKFCDLKSCGDSKHTLCLHPDPNPATSCGELGGVGLTQEEKDAILKAHNDHRAYVASGQETRGSNGGQPAATNIRPLVWNDEIAEIAQRSANQCTFGHDKCRNTANDYVGQNIAAFAWSDSFHDGGIVDMVDRWYDEVDKFDRNQIPSFTSGEGVGHYTQMIWGETTEVGCGFIRYHQPEEWYKIYLVCNYLPGGNVKTKPIYETA